MAKQIDPRQIKKQIRSNDAPLPEVFAYLEMLDSLNKGELSLWSGYSEKQITSWIASGQLGVCNGRITKQEWKRFTEDNTYSLTINSKIKELNKAKKAVA
jgi:hypothetical protein